MPCHHPIPAWRTQKGEILLQANATLRADAYRLSLPCSQCLGCRQAHAKAWALRCTLELQQHDSAVFTTLTYSDENLPVTLEKRHVQLWLKRLRKSIHRPIRFFASGEYGERTQRPHYHALVYGLTNEEGPQISETWGLGQCRTYPITPATIAYVAGYTSKKIGFKQRARPEQVDPDTGEVYTWQPPFIQMSRKPGIGGHARQWPESWRLYAVLNGSIMPVPRYLHDAWKKQATPEQQEELLYEKSKLALNRDTTERTLEAKEKIAVAKQAIQADRRKI